MPINHCYDDATKQNITKYINVGTYITAEYISAWQQTTKGHGYAQLSGSSSNFCVTLH